MQPDVYFLIAFNDRLSKRKKRLKCVKISVFSPVLYANYLSIILVIRQIITKFTFFFINIRNGIKLMVSGNECRTKEQTMSPWKVIITSAFFTLFASFNQQAATAGEKGTMDFVQSILIANQMAIEQGDHKMIAIVGNGTITFSNSDGGPFTEGSSAILSVIAYIKQTENGMNLESPMSVSDPSGDKLFMVMRRSTGTFDSGGGGQGRAELGGGTGKFAGVTGSCPYEVDFLDGGNVVVRATGCNWEKP